MYETSSSHGTNAAVTPSPQRPAPSPTATNASANHSATTSTSSFSRKTSKHTQRPPVSHRRRTLSPHFHKIRAISTKKYLQSPFPSSADCEYLTTQAEEQSSSRREQTRAIGEPEAALARVPGKELRGELEAEPARRPGKEPRKRIGNETRGGIRETGCQRMEPRKALAARM